MANEAILTADTAVTVITGAGTRADGAFSTEVVAISSNTYPFARAVLSCSFGVAPAEGTTVSLYRRDLNIDGTNDAESPDAGPNQTYLGSFTLEDTTAQQYIARQGVPLAFGDQEFYILNNGGQTMDADYTVKITPMTYVPAA